MDNLILEQLYSRYKREIYLYLYSLCGSHELAEDLLQETFLKAILSLKDNHTNMSAWLYMVARNLYFNYHKKQKRYVELDGDKYKEISSEQTGLLDQILQNESQKNLYMALTRLDSLKREVLTMQYFGEMSQKDIALILHISLENVRVLSFRGKKELRKYLENGGNV